MNIFEIYQKKIQNLITENSQLLNIESDIDIKEFTIEIPPLDFNFDLSSNIA